MKRRQFMQTLGASALATALPGAAAPKKKPNLLLLFTDDQTFRSIGSLNNPIVKTPNIDRLVKKGVTFTHCFNQGTWTGAVCIASRAMLNTGRYVYHAKRDIGGKDGPLVPLWGETLGNAGYDTFMTGKWHNGDAALNKAFQTVGPHGGGMLPSTPYDGDAYRRPTPENNTWQPDDKTRKGHWRKQPDGSIIHSSKEWADASINYLQDHVANSDNPFFMYVAFHAPHDPRQSPREYLDLYPLEDIEIPPNFVPEHPFDQGNRNTLRDEILAPFPRTEHEIKVHLQEYYAIISHADYHIGRILDALEASGELDNTIIMFSADHGLAVGQHGLMGKQNQYDHSIRMPLVLCGPGIDQGKQIDDMVYLHSLYATSCDLAGVPIPETVEFPSLVPLLNGGFYPHTDAIFGSYEGYQRMVRTDKYKLIVYPKINRIQLFNIQDDPWELYDLSGDPGNKKIIARLKRRLKELQKMVGDDLVI